MNDYELDLVKGYIKAITSHGGDYYDDWADFYTPENEALFYKWEKEQTKASGIELFRGYTFEQQFFEDGCYEVGRIITPSNLTAGENPAFTTGECRAAIYINDYGNGIGDGDVRVLFCLKTSGKYAVDISQFSRYPSEGEYHLCEDAKLRIVEIKKKHPLKIILEEV